MTAPTVVNSGKFAWAGAYPLAASGTFDSTGCDLVLIFFYTITGTGGGWSPTCTYNGASATLIGEKHIANSSAGTLYCWQIRGFSPGSHTVSVANGSQYCNNGEVWCVGLSGSQSTPIGASAFDLKDTSSGTISASAVAVATASDSLFINLAISGQSIDITPSGNGVGTLLDSYTSNADVKGKLYSSASISSGSSETLTVINSYNYAGAVVIEVMGSGGGGGGSPVTIDMTTHLSLSVALGGSLSMAHPHIDMTGHLSLSPALGSVSMAAPHIDMASHLSLSIGFPGGVMAAPHVSVSPLALTTALGAVEMGAPHLSVGPLSLTLALHAHEVAVPGLVIVDPLDLSLGLGSGDVITPPVLWADPLNLSLLVESGEVLAPWAISVGPLLLSLVPGEAEVLTYTPPIEADPLHLTLQARSGSVHAPWAVFTEPLSLDLSLPEGHIHLPIEITVPPLRLSWDRIPKPYGCARPLQIHMMIGRQLSGLHSVVVG